MRPDSSMSLLSDIASEAMDPEYLTTVAPRRNSRARFLALFLVAALLSVAMASTTRSRNEVADERNDLLSRIAAERQRRDELTARVGELGSENGRLRQESVADPSLRAELQRLETVTGAVAVSGPGIQIQVNDAEKAVNGRGVIYDSDLTRLVNGLWQSGAEAMAKRTAHYDTHTNPVGGFRYHSGLCLPEPALFCGRDRRSYAYANSFRPDAGGCLVAASSRQLWD